MEALEEVVEFGEIHVSVTRKDVQHVYLTVHPPNGRVTLVAPTSTKLDVARAYVASKITWIRTQQRSYLDQAREPARRFVERESHYIWGRRFLLRIAEVNQKPFVEVDHRHLTLSVRAGTDRDGRARVMREWHKELLHDAIPKLIDKWEAQLGVEVRGYFLQRMKTKWGSCNHQRGTIRLNTELVKKPPELLEYVVVHEMLHLIEPTHSDAFVTLLNRHYPTWREARDELNSLPLGAEEWDEDIVG